MRSFDLGCGAEGVSPLGGTPPDEIPGLAFNVNQHGVAPVATPSDTSRSKKLNRTRSAGCEPLYLWPLA